MGSQSVIVNDSNPDDQLVMLMDQYERSLYRFLFVLLGDDDIASDCTQDTFVRAYHNLCRGKPVNARWLFTVGRNRAMDEFRHQRRQPVSLQSIEFTSADTSDTPHQWVAMRDAFAQLSSDDRAVLYLSSVEGLNGEEIAQMLGIKITALRVRLSRARQRFRCAYDGAS